MSHISVTNYFMVKEEPRAGLDIVLLTFGYLPEPCKLCSVE